MSKIDNAYLNYQTTVAYYQARLSLVYSVQTFQKPLDSLIAANNITTNVSVKRTADQTEKNPTSESLDDVRTTKNNRMKRRSSHWRCFIKKSVHRTFTKFTGKHLCQSCLI